MICRQKSTHQNPRPEPYHIASTLTTATTQEKKEATKPLGHAIYTHKPLHQEVTNFWKLLEVGLKLAIMVRDFETGEKFTSLQYHWVVGLTTICKFCLPGHPDEFQEDYLSCPTDLRRTLSEMCQETTLGTEKAGIYQSFSGLPNYSKNF